MSQSVAVFENFNTVDFQNKMRRFADNRNRLDAIYEELLYKYPNEWVAFENGVITRARSIEELVELLENPATAAVGFLDPNEKILILTR